MRVLFATDLHGSTLVLRKALRVSREFDVDHFLLGGDVSGKWLLPLIKVGDDLVVYEPGEKVLTTEQEGSFPSQQISTFEPRTVSRLPLAEHLARFEAKGYYWHFFGSEQEVHSLTPENYEKLQSVEIANRLDQWGQLVRKGIGPERKCFWTGGNDDDESLLDQYKITGDDAFSYVEGKIVDLGDEINLLSLGHSNPTPFATARELPEAALGAELWRVYEQAGRPENLVLNVHVPPFNCDKLDLCESLGGGWIHVGSTAIRDFVEAVEPIAVFSGHIHEGKGAARIGKSIILNPGSAFNSGTLLAFVVDIKGKEVKDYTHILR